VYGVLTATIPRNAIVLAFSVLKQQTDYFGEKEL
jgi:hypothetical protein